MLPAIAPDHIHRPSSPRRDRHSRVNWSKQRPAQTSAFEGMRTVDTIGAHYEKYPRYLRAFIIIGLSIALWTLLFMGASALLSAI